MSTPTKTHLIVLGTGDFAVDVTDLLDDLPGMQVEGYAVSDGLEPSEPTFLGRPVYRASDLAGLAATHQALCAIGSTHRDRFVEQVAACGMRFATLIHPTARVSRRARIGEGVIVSSGVQVAAEARIARHVIVNRGALIGHHTVLEEFVTVAPGANLAGNVTVRRRAWVGLGAVVLEKRSIGEAAVVGIGAVVMRPVPDRATVLGNPAAIVARDGDGL